jgi:DNA-binding FadR family transcriptional regulator
MVTELLDVRRVIEPAAARLAAERAGPPAIEVVRRAWEALRDSAADESAFIAADLAFHAAVLSASGNQLLVQMLDAIAYGLRATRLVTQRAAAHQRRLISDRIAIHGPVYEAIAAGDAVGAETAMRAVVDIALRDAQRVLGAEEGEVQRRTG